MIQTKFNTLYICEIKFLKETVGSSIIDEVQKKINALKHPKGYSFHLALIFLSIIDFSKHLED